MPITKLQKTLTQTVRNVSENKETVFILKNNAMEAVMIPFKRFKPDAAIHVMLTRQGRGCLKKNQKYKEHYIFF